MTGIPHDEDTSSHKISLCTISFLLHNIPDAKEEKEERISYPSAVSANMTGMLHDRDISPKRFPMSHVAV